MEQNKILINGKAIHQPDSGGLTYNFETTYTASTGRPQSGVLKSRALFTVEQLGYTATNVPAAKVAEILQMIATGKPFDLTYYSLYYGEWRTDQFSVGRGSGGIKTLKVDKETVSQLNFNMTGINPLKEDLEGKA